MITSFADVGTDDSWNGRSIDHGVTVPNKNTTLTLNDHKRLVFSAKSIVATFSPEKVTGWPEAAVEAFNLLKTCYQCSDAMTLKIVKGIHQPRNDPHLDVRVRGSAGYITQSFHIDLTSVEAVVEDAPSTLHLAQDPFHWKVHSISYKVGTVIRRWPLAPGERVGKDFARQRRNSISEYRLARDLAQANFERDKQEIGRQITPLQTIGKTRIHLTRDDKNLIAMGEDLSKGGYKWSWDPDARVVSRVEDVEA